MVVREILNYNDAMNVAARAAERGATWSEDQIQEVNAKITRGLPCAALVGKGGRRPRTPEAVAAQESRTSRGLPGDVRYSETLMRALTPRWALR